MIIIHFSIKHSFGLVKALKTYVIVDMNRTYSLNLVCPKSISNYRVFEKSKFTFTVILTLVILLLCYIKGYFKMKELCAVKLERYNLGVI